MMTQVGSKFYPAKGNWYAGYDVLPMGDEQRKNIMPTAYEQIAELVAMQAEDEGLWFEAKTAPEAYLQNALRELHAAVEFLNKE